MAGTEERLPYLALALLAQRALEGLPTLSGGVAPALELAAADRIASLLAPPETAEGGATFEEVRTVEEACPEADRAAAIAALGRLKRGAWRDDDAVPVLAALQKIEAQALRNFEDPPASPPRGILALCQQR